MKRVALFLGAVIFSVMLSSCGGNTKEKIYNEVNAFFAQKEAEIQAIDNADDLLAFVNAMDELPELEIVGKYADENNKIKGLNEEDANKLMDMMHERRAAYLAIEQAKCTEIMEPLITDYEGIVADLYEDYENDLAEADEEKLEKWEVIYDQIYDYADIIPDELADRFLEADEVIDFMFGLGDYSEEEVE